MKELRYWECPECHHYNPYLQRKCDCGHIAGGDEAKYKTCPSCGCFLPASRLVCDCGAFLTHRRIGARLFVIALAILCAVSIAGNIYQAVSNREAVSELQDEIEEQKQAITTLRTGKDQLAKQVADLKAENKEIFNEYFDEHMTLNYSIGYIVYGSDYYHNYHCPVFEAAERYTAHNVEYCEYLGYGKCPVCLGD